MNAEVWCDSDDRHPVDAFWPGRFLKYPNDSKVAQFSLTGKEGSWLPFGSGANHCPGRQFAKLHCIVTLAMMVENLDCDIIAAPKNLKLNMSKFGMGVMGSSGKVTVRLRRRDVRG
jgi:cytochrome P450